MGIIRQSKGREDSLSPAEQRERIASACERDGHQLVGVHEEIDVSGGTPLERREGLRAAVEAVEAGSVDIVMVAYFDRLFRSLRVQGEVVTRVEQAGGRLVALDFGDVSEATAVHWLQGTMMGAWSEFYRRMVRERSGAAQKMAVTEGRVPYEHSIPGYSVDDDGRLVPDDLAPVTRRAFEMRAEGATVGDVRSFLRGHGVERSFSSVQRLLGNDVVLGVLRFGKLVNDEAHPPIVDRATFERVQSVRERRGLRPKSDRLLARLGVLRCGNCGARMSVGFQTTRDGRRYDFYRCPPVGDCQQRVTISADIAERFVIDQVQVALADLRGRASAFQGAQEADARAERAQAELDSAIRILRELRDEPAAIEELRALREARDVAVAEAEHLRRLSSALTIDVGDWDRLTLEERRGLVRETIEAVFVGPGRGAGRLSAKLLIE